MIKSREIVVTKLVQAGMIVATRDIKILCDPLVSGNRVCDVFSLPKDYYIDQAALKKTKFDAVVISHGHHDHFQLESLDHIHRDCPIYYPAPAPFIMEQMKILGFRFFKPMAAHRKYRIGDLELIPIKSEVRFPEFGFIFRNGSLKIYNLVDIRISTKRIKKLIRRFGRPDLLFSYYQCLNESGVANRQLKTLFPKSIYQEFFDVVKAFRPRAVIPSSNDIRFSDNAWLNSHLFPISKKQFIRDVRTADPKIRGYAIEPGQTFTLSRRGLKLRAPLLPELRLNACRPVELPWRPEVGHRFVDYRFNVRTRSDELRIKRETRRFLARELLPLMQAKKGNAFVQFLRRENISWRLRLVHPDRTEDVRDFSFSRRGIRCATPAEHDLESNRVLDIETIWGSANLLRIVSGERGTYEIVSGTAGIQIQRKYFIDRWKIRSMPNDNFLWYFLKERIEARSLRFRYRRMGYPIHEELGRGL